MRLTPDSTPSAPGNHRGAKSGSTPVRDAASEAVRRIESKANNFRTKLLPGASKTWRAPSLTSAAMPPRILGGFGPHSSPAVPSLIRGLDDRDASVCLASTHALGLIGTAARDAPPALAENAA